jgi:hypothetical protein
MEDSRPSAQIGFLGLYRPASSVFPIVSLREIVLQDSRAEIVLFLSLPLRIGVEYTISYKL